MDTVPAIRQPATPEAEFIEEEFVEQGGGFEIDFRALWLILKRNLWVVGGIVLAVLVLGLVATMLMTPKYTASSSVQIDQEAAQVLGQDQSVQPVSSYQDADRFLQTQVDVLKSRAMELRVAQALDLFNKSADFFSAMKISSPKPDPKVSRDQQLRDAVLSGIEDNLSVNLPPDSRVATIAFTSPDPKLAAQIANSYASEFIKSNLQRTFNSTAYARNFLSQQLGEAKAKLEQSEQDLNNYARQMGLIKTQQTNADGSTSTGSASVTTASLAQLNQAANDATAARIAAEEKWKTVENTPLLSIPDVLANQAIQNLLDQRASASAALSQELAKHKDAYPTVQQYKAQLKQIDDQINVIATGIKQSVKQAYESARLNEQSLGAQVHQLKNETLTEQDRSVRYNILAREADTNRTLYEGLLQRYKEVSASAGITASNVSVVDQADVPIRPSSPRLFLNMALALLAGLALAGGVVFIREQLDDAIRAPEDVERKLGLSTLGIIPVTDNENARDELASPRSPVAEAYNSLRTALLYSTAQGLPPVLLVTSTEAAEGKSTTSYAAAMGLARLGKRVVLVDVDLRRPSQHHAFSVAAKPGLSDLLTSHEDIASVLHETTIDNLSFIPAGPIPPSPTELLGNQRLNDILDELQRRFDIVILDGPPVLGLADAPLLASIAGSTMFVIEASRGHRGATKAALKRLRTGHAHVLGAVLTKFNPKNANSGYAYYGYQYYQYGNNHE
ncbi:polysaccharide biosynthesis tyrosine autokinase [Stakelama sediminis]|uniref:non-specific protein-tyrosine kinase n=2 Tax=Stakelama sediminis TaxID=463200 RepID=A0A840Z3S1_9SPHN|nr:polysaccharide biosynthesis tyrosine autokinase [Stakelama sediminis]MBB5720387.1 capsular exopolysaccharide synthesis family protein [Stakelama sediminis]